MSFAVQEPEANPRQDLANRIARVGLFERDLKINTDAQAETRVAIENTRERVAKARLAAEEQCHTRSIADVQSALQTTKAARKALEEAEETLQALRLHFDRLEVQAGQLRSSLEYARMGLDRAVAAVAWPTVEAVLLARYKAAQNELMSLAATIRSLRNVVPPKEQYWDAARSEPAQIDMRWAEWVEALHKDAAVLPPEEG